MARLIACLAALVIFADVATVYAQAKGGGDMIYKKQTKYDFDDDLVEGDLVRPDDMFVESRDKARYGSLITIRKDFIPEMLKSAEDI
ncbi:MAG TPA: hypothetical protein VGQ83_23890 [Polyangia bacterium]|jgi:hypothetical protein